MPKHPSEISINAFTYELPDEKIAKFPLAERDRSKLLVYKDGSITESVFEDLDTFIEEDTLLVFNETKVIQARLNFLNQKGQSIEIFCLEPTKCDGDLHTALNVQINTRWNCLIGNLRRWKTPELVLRKNDTELRVQLAAQQKGYGEVDFFWSPEHLTFAEILEIFGNMPIPPYLKRESESSDKTRYQTLYSKKEGSVAAPTAGLHFTERLFHKLKDQNIKTASLTLHVGAGTFKPVKSATMEGHEMHAEWMEVGIATIQKLIDQQNKTSIAVGTTSLRTIETLYWMGLKALANPNASLSELEIKQWEVYDLKDENKSTADCFEAMLLWMKKNGTDRLICQTQILIAPPYQLKVASGLITNFHQPQSTLLLLVAAVVGERWKEIYDYALGHKFRFLSYGDSSLLFKQ
ncbi:MAG: S-adenosylmethionine:tRNA ribosyltransferase-isomerase [bacterium]|nr:S-adenosylmethionine:tRNA ribosyltransferase-isomerase [bacterium]